MWLSGLWMLAKVVAELVGLLAIAGLWLWTIAEILRRDWPTSGERVAWLLVVILLPLVGVLLYRMLVPAPIARPRTR